MIQFYNVQFYNQGSSPYNTAQTLFNASGGWAAGTSVNEIIARGVPSNKIVVGKPATINDANAASYMNPSTLNSAIVANYEYNGWHAGVMFWQYSSDPNGTICSTAISGLMGLIGVNSTQNSTHTTSNTTTTNSSNTNSTTNSTGTNHTNNSNTTNTPNTNITNNNTTNSNATNNNVTNPNTTNSTTTNSTNNTSTNSTSNNNSLITYPIRFAYIDKIADWSSPTAIAKSMGIPGYAPDHIYNYLCLSIWTYSYGPFSAAMIWDNPIGYFGTASAFGSTNAQIRSSIKQILSSKDIKLMLGIFGQVELPSTSSFDPVKCAEKLATYVSGYGYDGVDINWNDDYSFIIGKGEEWLANFTLSLKALLPSLIITHSPKAAYFATYVQGGYAQVHKLTGSAVSFYNVIFYGQAKPYNTGQSLFNSSTGTALNEIIAKGVPGNKLVVGKTSAANCGDFASYMSGSVLGKAFLD